MRCTMVKEVSLLLICILQTAAIYIFVCGFFLVRTERQNYDFKGSDWKDILGKGCENKVSTEFVKEATKKVVIILIDAWRADFLYNSNAMRFTKHSIESGHAVGFIAQLQAPTVTMPRIKAVTAGIVPSFADIVLNFASTSFAGDNIIDALKEKGYRLTFCGDDTWLRLFPGRFGNTSEGVVSFYVNDYTEARFLDNVLILHKLPGCSCLFTRRCMTVEMISTLLYVVDNNVTRCMNANFEVEAASDWDLMIIHYLGLDHIGHSLGGTHDELNKKLIEMDGVIENVYNRFLKISGGHFAMLIFGDHGMTEFGSHGGNSEFERNVAFVFMDDKLKNISAKEINMIEQVDIVPTLAAIFNTRIPAENLGITLLPYVYGYHNHSVSALSALQNALQLLQLTHTDDLSTCIEALKRVACGNDLSTLDHTMQHCLRTMRILQKQLLESKTTLDYKMTCLGIALSIMGALLSVMVTCNSYKKLPCRKLLSKQWPISVSTCALCLIQVLRLISHFSSSLIEEEHDLQYFFFTTVLFVLSAEMSHLYLEQIRRCDLEGIRSQGKKLFGIATLTVIHRFCRGYVESQHRRWLLDLELISAATKIVSDRYWAFYRLTTSADSVPAVDFSTALKSSHLLCTFGIVTSLLLISIYCSIFLARKHHKLITFILLIPLLVSLLQRAYFKKTSNVLACWLLRIMQIILLLITRDISLCIISWILSLVHDFLLPLAVSEITIGLLLAVIDAEPLLIVLASYSAFFFMGNQNSFSKIDVSVGYNCVGSYQPFLVAIQIALNTYSGPLLVLLSWWLFKRRNADSDELELSAVISTVGTVLQLDTSVNSLAVYMMSRHLFVWSVFAPKYMYAVSHFLIFSLSVHYLCLKKLFYFVIR